MRKGKVAVELIVVFALFFSFLFLPIAAEGATWLSIDYRVETADPGRWGENTEYALLVID